MSFQRHCEGTVKASRCISRGIFLIWPHLTEAVQWSDLHLRANQEKGSARLSEKCPPRRAFFNENANIQPNSSDFARLDRLLPAVANHGWWAAQFKQRVAMQIAWESQVVIMILQVVHRFELFAANRLNSTQPYVSGWTFHKKLPWKISLISDMFSFSRKSLKSWSGYREEFCGDWSTIIHR